MKKFTKKYVFFIIIILFSILVIFELTKFKKYRTQTYDIALERFNTYIDASVNGYLLCPDAKNIKLRPLFEKAFAYYSKQEYPRAQYLIGIAYSNGIGVNPDSRKSLAWLRKSALQGYVPAQVGYANLLISGTPGENKPLGQLDKKTLGWLESAAAKQDSLANFVLATYYFTSEKVPEAMWITLFERVAAQENDPNSALAQYQLGDLYSRGVGFAKNDTRAIYWLKKSIDHKPLPMTAGLAMITISYIYGDPVTMLVSDKKTGTINTVYRSLYNTVESDYWSRQVDKMQQWFDRCRETDPAKLDPSDLSYQVEVTG